MGSHPFDQDHAALVAHLDNQSVRVTFTAQPLDESSRVANLPGRQAFGFICARRRHWRTLAFALVLALVLDVPLALRQRHEPVPGIEAIGIAVAQRGHAKTRARRGCRAGLGEHPPQHRGAQTAALKGGREIEVFDAHGIAFGPPRDAAGGGVTDPDQARVVRPERAAKALRAPRRSGRRVPGSRA